MGNPTDFFELCYQLSPAKDTVFGDDKHDSMPCFKPKNHEGPHSWEEMEEIFGRWVPKSVR